MFPNIRNTWFNQSSPLQSNNEDFFLLIYFLIEKEKILPLFPNIKNMQFDQSSPVQQIPEKKSGKNFQSHKKKTPFFKTEIFEQMLFSTQKMLCS